MKFLITTLPLVAVTSAFVLPDARITQQLLQAETERIEASARKAVSAVKDAFKDVIPFPGNDLDMAMESASWNSKTQAQAHCQHPAMESNILEWLHSEDSTDDDSSLEASQHPHKRPKKHPHHGKKPTLSVYEMIAGSKHTTKLTKFINKYPDLVESLNSTEANYTIFAPTDKAFEKIPHHGDHKPSAEVLKKILSYHILPDLYHAGEVFFSHTLPTALEESFGPQRLRVSIGFRGLTLNFYSKVIAADIPATNGAIYAVDSILIPPPPALKIIDLLPGEFSTLQLALIKTGLASKIAEAPHSGGTFFVPSNLAFKKLGPKINAFLFSSYGEKYLKALLKYHIVANQTLYSDAFYKAKSEEVGEADIPKGTFHVDLETMLKEKSLSIDVARWGRIINMKINGFGSVAVQDGISRDGVIHVVSNILIPPRSPGARDYTGEEMTVEELKDRLDSFIPEL